LSGEDAFFYATSWTEFLHNIRSARKQLGDPPKVWYRGQSKDSYRLTPSLLRNDSWIAKEQTLFDEYERSASHLQAPRNNDWELLIDMQHYGIPTRLMDWTDVLGIAIAFALYDSNDDEVNSAIYVLDPIKLNELSGLSEVKRAPNDPAFEYKSVYWHGRPFSPSHPIAIDSALQNDRIRAQSGSFTVHGRNKTAIDDQATNVIRKVVIGAAAKREAREFLEYANLNSFSIYPDIVGMARHIVRKHLTG